MQLLIISNNPTRASFRQRIGIYLDSLQADDINCEVAKLPINEACRARLFIRAKKFDGVFLHKKRLNFIDAILLRRFARKIIYDFDDAVMYNENNPKKRSSRRHTSFKRTARLADLIIAGNSYLAEHAASFNNNTHTLPTGLDTKTYDINKPESDGKIRLAWIGSKSTLKYLEEIKDALEQTGRLYKNVVLRIICDKFIVFQNLKVEKVAWNLEGQYSALRECDIGLAPLPDNNFTKGKCGFKILQYQAAELPVIASPIGMNAELIEDGKTGIFAKDINQWSDKIRILIENLELRNKLSDAAKKNVIKFDCTIIGSQLNKLIKKCLPTTDKNQPKSLSERKISI